MSTGESAVEGRRRAGRWLPDPASKEAWLDELADAVERRPADAPLGPAVAAFAALLERDPLVRMHVTEMLAQLPPEARATRRLLPDVPALLRTIDTVIGTAPEFNETGLVGVPLNAVLDECMHTPGGFVAFRLPQVNAALQEILRAWCAHLSSPASCDVLNPGPRGWQSDAACRETQIEEFVHDPAAPHWGFTSWNDFFTRRFRPGARPVAAPGDDAVLVHPCEATPVAISTNARREDRFWLKAQPYSLGDMLAGDPAVDALDGGTVYQAYLDAHSYHRWHSPVSGVVRRAFVVGGTYYSEGDAEGENQWQGYLAHVAARAVIILEADAPALGTLALVFIGMGEVSSCVIHPTSEAGSRVRKGDELGYFQYGGSSYCAVFRPGAIASFATAALPDPHTGRAAVQRVGTPLATAARP